MSGFRCLRSLPWGYRSGEQEHILDVATGTGWTARRVAEWGARVTGVDISGEELDAARRLSRRMGLDIDYRLADAEALPFEGVRGGCLASMSGNNHAASTVRCLRFLY